ncbi:putative serine/threonine-protein kinase [Forsythia ovata]|uniref:Serine/threonine-protein kinase n=1 Tax=Forsythia ovata TaxID=205694 RepID=A0ABD1PM85_9LAMI
MGCVFGREISSSGPPSGEFVAGKGREKREERDSAVPSARREKVVYSESKADSGGGTSGVQNGRDQKEEQKDGNARSRGGERRRSRPNPRLSNPPKNIHGEQVAAGWPAWLSAVAGEAINGWTPRRADTFEKIDKIGQGTYSNVYKARDAITGKDCCLEEG